MYNMHKFFARKQEDVIREYIKAYSHEDDIVLDPFCGSGVMIGEALKLGRRAIGIDINPVAIFITRNTVRYVDPRKIKREFKKIEKDVKDDINSLYVTSCRKCKDNILPAVCFTWDKGKLIDVRYECPHHGRLISKVNKEDIELYEKIERGELEGFFDKHGVCRYWYPTKSLYYKDGTPFLKKEKFESVDDIFTKRNLIALAKLLDRIRKTEDSNIREAFLFAFSSITHLASRMTPVRPSRPFSSAWVQQSYWYCPNNMESNVWNLFRRAVKKRQSLISAKKDLPENFKNLREAKTFKQLQKGTKHHFLLAQSAIDALEEIDENTIDYVITDPPYGHSIQYAELLFMWGCWLDLMDDFDEIARGEIVENPKQRKTEKEYENMLYVAFRKVFDVLKPGGYCTITFHNPKLKYRNILFRSVVMAGFEFEKITYQPPPRPSAKSLLQPYGSLEGDYFFRFRKPKTKRKKRYETVDQKRVEILIVNLAKRIIADRGEPTHYTFIQNSIDPILYEELRKYGLVMDFQPESVKKTLKKYVGKIFELVEMKVGKKGQKALMGKGWWFIDPTKHRLDIPLNKRVDEAIVNLLRQERRVSFTEVLTEVYTRFQNALTPEQHTIMDILKENADRIKGGKWAIKPFVEKIKRQHEEMVFYLATLGIKAGYKVDIGKDEYGKFFGEKRLGSELPLTPPEIKQATDDQVKRIGNIDVIWHDGEDVVAEFEVEHSTSIVDAVVRGSNIKSTETFRIMVVPEEREDLVHRRFHEPAMQSMMKDMTWKIMTYKTLRNLYREYKRKKHMSVKEIEGRTRKPFSKEQKEKVIQQKLV